MLQISLLGPFAVSQDNAPLIAFKTDHSRAILAYTAANRGVPQRRDAIAGMLWPDDPNDKALKKFRVELNRLRPVIGDADASPAHFFINRKELEFNPDSHAAVDVVEFETLLDEVDQHDHRTLAGCPSCISKLERASALYRGEFMAGFNLNSDVWQAWLTKQREGFKLQALEAFSLLCSVQQERREWEPVLELGQKMIDLDPWNEDGYQALMRASYRLGDRAGAMGWYEACEKILYEELGVDPSVETLDLQQQILDDELLETAAGGAAIPDNLPEQSGRFFGRAQELDELQNLLVDPNHRLVTLVGAGGIGKTRLSIQAGQGVKESFPDGVWFVQLASANGGIEQIKVAIGEAAGLNQNNDGKQLSGDQVIAILREKKILLILDNSEYVLEDIAFIPEWLRRAPDVAILASSREPLNFQTETVVNLAGLELNGAAETVEEAGAAVGLFAERGKMARSDFEVTAENLPKVQEICDMVGGSPLAISLAAAWLRRRSLQKIIDSINQSLDFLTSRMRDIDPRHQSMRAVFETSWELLEPEDQMVFAALSVFPGSFSEDAGLEVAGVPIYDLDILCEKSLLMQQHAEERYLMHGLLRQFAVGKLNELKLTDQFEVAFLSYFYRYAEEHQEGYEALRPEWSNFSAGIEIAFKHQAWQRVIDFTDVLDEPWFRQARYSDMRPALSHAIESAKALKIDETIAKKMLRLGEIEMEQNDYDSATEVINTSLIYFHQVEDGHGIAYAQYCLGRIDLEQSRFDRALDFFKQYQQICEDINDHEGLSNSFVHQAYVWLFSKQEYDRAIELARKALQIQEEKNLAGRKIQSLRVLALANMDQHQFDVAKIQCKNAIEISQEIGDLSEYAAALYLLSIIYRMEGDYRLALKVADESLDHFKRMGILRWQGLVIFQKGRIMHSQRKYEATISFYKQSIQIFQEVKDLLEEAYSHLFLARLYVEMEEADLHILQKELDHVKKIAETLNNDQLLKDVEMLKVD